MTDKDNSGGNPLLNKLKTLEELGVISDKARKDGKTVVLAHGTFDLLHIGHLRHLRLAKREGDILIVTITADAHVNKGPGRPVFAEQMRAEMLAAIECIDYVGINDGPKALEVIQAVKPSKYVKGSDYKNAQDDVTGGIVEERAAVEEHGGELVFTDEITFSSSSLINRHLAVFDPTLDEYLEAQRSKGILDQLTELIDKVKNYRILMIGDAIIDDYVYVSALGKSPKEHMIATLFEDREVFAGGVFAAANHVADFCKEVEIVTTLGEGCEYEKMIRGALRPNVTLNAFYRENAPTTRKTRFIDRSYLRKMFEVYDMDDTPTDVTLERVIDRMILQRASDFDMVIVTDFGHGLMTPTMIASLERTAKFLAVNTQSNSANLGFNLITKYPRTDYICIDAPEARLATGDRRSDIEDIASRALPERISCPKLIVTHGKNGCIGYEHKSQVAHVPAFTKTVVDTVGAGDAFFAVTAPLAAAGGKVDQLAFIGNAAGAIKVGIVGHRNSVEKISVLKFLTTLLK